MILAGALFLLGLNARRDLSRVSASLSWEPVAFKTLYQTVDSTGVMEAIRVVAINAQVDEVLVKKFAREGDAVKKGQPLLELSCTKTQVEYEQRKNALQNAKADYRKARREEKIQQRLYKDRAVSWSQWDDAIRSRERAQAALEMARREFELAQEKKDSTLVRSPLDGVVLKDRVASGTAVSAGAELITVGDVSDFVVRTKIDELDIKHVQTGQPVTLVLDAYPDRPMKGRVHSIAIQAEREAFAKIEVLIEIAEKPSDLPLRHNLSVHARILTEEIPHSLGVPVKAIEKKKADASWVITRGPWGLIREKEIRLGRLAGDEVEVLSGLRPGEFVGYNEVRATDL